MAVPYLEVVIGFIVAVSVFHWYLDVRQLKAIQQPKPPAALDGVFTQDLYQKTQAYSLDKWWYGFYHGLFSLTQTLLILSLKLLPAIWHAADVLARTLPLVPAGEAAASCVFVLLLGAVGMVLDLPWDLYRTFVIEQKHGFNKMTLRLYVSDMVKQVLLSLVLVPPIVAGLVYILRQAGPLVALYLWGFILVLSLVMMTVYPTLIAPLFNKYAALPEGSLRTRIEALASSLSFPLRKLYTMDGSKRSGHSNAYMYGFFSNKRIVLYDTLINQCSEEQVVAVLAHELGHWKLRHTPVLFVTGQAVMLAQFALFTLLRSNQDLFSAFGFVHVRPAFISLVLFQYLSAPLDEVVSFLSNLVSRLFEFQADRFAVKCGHGAQLRTALVRLEEENKSSMHVDPWYSTYHYSHPPLVERLKAIDTNLKKAL